jgi:hypothetical protein
MLIVSVGVKMLKRLFAVLTFATLFTGCTYVASVTQTNLPKNRGDLVKAEVKKYIVLGFNFDNDEFTRIPDKLAAKCQGGRVEGVLTKDQFTLYALMFFWARHVEVSGYCQKSSVALQGDLL